MRRISQVFEPMHTSFKMKAVVTGGGSGIGAMIATTLVQNGAKVYIASRKEKQLQEVSIGSS